MKQKLLVVFALALVLVLSAFAPTFQRQVYDYVVTKRLTVLKGGALFSSGLDMDNNAIQNIGAAGTDFGSDGSLTTAAGITITTEGLTMAGYNTITPKTAISVTASSVITPGGSYQPLQSAGAVTATMSSGCTAGRLVRLINSVNQTITISETATSQMAGNFGMGQYDSLTFLCDGTYWVEMARSNN